MKEDLDILEKQIKKMYKEISVLYLQIEAINRTIDNLKDLDKEYFPENYEDN